MTSLISWEEPASSASNEILIAMRVKSIVSQSIGDNRDRLLNEWWHTNISGDDSVLPIVWHTSGNVPSLTYAKCLTLYVFRRLRGRLLYFKAFRKAVPVILSHNVMAMQAGAEMPISIMAASLISASEWVSRHPSAWSLIKASTTLSLL